MLTLNIHAILRRLTNNHVGFLHRLAMLLRHEPTLVHSITDLKCRNGRAKNESQEAHVLVSGAVVEFFATCPTSHVFVVKGGKIGPFLEEWSSRFCKVGGMDSDFGRGDDLAGQIEVQMLEQAVDWVRQIIKRLLHLLGDALR